MTTKTAHHVSNRAAAHAAEMFSAIGTSLPVIIVMAKSENAITQREVADMFPELEAQSVRWMFKKLLDAHLIEGSKAAGPGRVSYYYVHQEADRFMEAIFAMVKDLEAGA